MLDRSSAGAAKETKLRIISKDIRASESIRERNMALEDYRELSDEDSEVRVTRRGTKSTDRQKIRKKVERKK